MMKEGQRGGGWGAERIGKEEGQRQKSGANDAVIKAREGAERERE